MSVINKIAWLCGGFVDYLVFVGFTVCLLLGCFYLGCCRAFWFCLVAVGADYQVKDTILFGTARTGIEKIR